MRYKNFSLLDIEEEDRVKSKKAYKLVKKFFNGDEGKTRLWFITRNPLAGNLTPMFMIYSGRIDKLLNFIECQLQGNMP